MSKFRKQNVIPQMFDVRPVDRSGDVDWDRIRSIGKATPTQELSNDSWETVLEESDPALVEPETIELGSDFFLPKETFSERTSERVIAPRPVTPRADRSDRIRGEGRYASGFRMPRIPFRSAAFAVSVIFFFGGGAWLLHGTLSLRGTVLGESTEGLSYASRGFDDLSRARFDHSARNFVSAHESFSEASDALGTVGNELAKGAKLLGLSKISSGQGMLEGAKHLSSAGASISGMLSLLPVSGDGIPALSSDRTLLSLLEQADVFASAASKDIASAEESLARVDADDIPEDKRDLFLSIREKLPIAKTLLAGFHDNSILIRDLLGEDGPRTYLFLFQNNHELRPTGGFIGSYGLLRVSHGEIQKFIVDGIFNPDGQLRADIVPPAPIQKVSAGWSLHDSNWWPDFPTSAEKAVFFYEKTGGPTVDGIVTLTPTVIEDLLRVTGPIDMPEYGVTIDADNFIPAIQEEVEVNYDRERNEPKKILSDLAPLLFERLLGARSPEVILSVVESLSKGLNERHILLYSRNGSMQDLLDRAGWSGRILETPHDYASVVHTNLNGYKTDGVIDESIVHQARIQSDGSVLDTIRITRNHTGGDSPYDWWNRVNSDYMRVYVPLGSELVSARGYTYEFPKPPLDYDALGFKKDKQVVEEERSTVIHESGTRISVESGKTVFGNWVYVSPGESVTVEYTYRLPFPVSPRSPDPDSYSVLFQKQSGTPGSAVRHTLSFPESFVPVWDTGGAARSGQEYSVEGVLKTDMFFGSVFMRQ